MKKSAELLKKLPDLVKETKENKLQWKIEFQTTEYNDPSEKPTEQIDGKEFLLITYEQIASFEAKKKSYNLAFVPPLGNRFFDVDLLAPYAVELDQMLAYEIHMLWLTILEKLKEHSKNITIDVSPRDSAVENKQMRE